jgi:hypothetical protein
MTLPASQHSAPLQPRPVDPAPQPKWDKESFEGQVGVVIVPPAIPWQSADLLPITL